MVIIVFITENMWQLDDHGNMWVSRPHVYNIQVGIRFLLAIDFYFRHNQTSLYINLVCFDRISSRDNFNFISCCLMGFSAGVPNVVLGNQLSCKVQLQL